MRPTPTTAREQDEFIRAEIQVARMARPKWACASGASAAVRTVKQRPRPSSAPRTVMKRPFGAQEEEQIHQGGRRPSGGWRVPGGVRRGWRGVPPPGRKDRPTTTIAETASKVRSRPNATTCQSWSSATPGEHREERLGGVGVDLALHLEDGRAALQTDEDGGDLLRRQVELAHVLGQESSAPAAARRPAIRGGSPTSPGGRCARERSTGVPVRARMPTTVKGLSVVLGEADVAHAVVEDDAVAEAW
jgi:hypothetical protein